MSGQHVILIRDSDCPSDAASSQAQAILEQCPMCRRLRVRCVSVADVLNGAECLDGGNIAWIRVDRTDAGQLFEVIGLVQDRHMPALLTRGGEREPLGAMHQDGVVVCPPDTPPITVCAMLQTLRTQVPGLRAMRAELKLLRAHQGGLCDQIGRIDEELRLAAQLQREFLPKSMVEIGDVGFRVLFRPATYVSGDIYDVIRLDEKHIGFFIADAVGHGVPAALLTMYIKRSLVTKKIDPSSPRGYRLTEPAEALQKLNRDLLEQQGGQVRFATACYGVVNCETLEVCIARAGHPFPLLLRAGGATDSIEPDGGLLGVFAEEQYDQICVKLHAGDRLLLYSDGFETAFPNDADASSPSGPGAKRIASTRYVAEFEEFRDVDVDDAMLRLQEKLDVQTGSLNQRDDLTLVCLSVAAAVATPLSTPVACEAA